MTTPRVLLPLFVDIVERDVLVVGAGEVAERKVTELLHARASIRVVAPEATAAIRDHAERGMITWTKAAFVDAHVGGAWLVVAATADRAAQKRVAAACGGARVFCVAVDDPANASAYGGSILRRGALTVAISTSGEAPALARLVREVLEQALPEEGWIEAARELRKKWKRDRTPMRSRFAELVDAFKQRS